MSVRSAVASLASASSPRPSRGPRGPVLPSERRRSSPDGFHGEHHGACRPALRPRGARPHRVRLEHGHARRGDAAHPRTVRIDASLEVASTGPDALDLRNLLERVAAVRAVGAEPIVILSYMPEWLGTPNANGRDPTRVPPSDPDAWEALIQRVVHELAIAPAPAYRFEVWNEPDNPIFWQDLPVRVRRHGSAHASSGGRGSRPRRGCPCRSEDRPLSFPTRSLSCPTSRR